MTNHSPVRLAIAGIGQRAGAYLQLCRNSPEVDLAALCDISESRASCFARKHGYETVHCYTDLEELFQNEKIEGLVITVPDFAHKEAAVTAFRHHCGIMLEKPMAPNVSDCRDILEAWKQSGCVMQIGFVLRFHPFYRKLKELISQGRIGDLINIEATETLGLMHGASYMRRWHRKSCNSGGFLLAKCSHDLDILSFLTGSRPVRVSSFGSLGYFLPEKQKAPYCSQCMDRTCPFRFQGEMVAMTDEEKQNPSHHRFDLCVYNNDKDIVDRQNVLLEYPNHVEAFFSLNLFAHTGNRYIRIHGSEGILEGNMNDSVISLTRTDGKEEKFDCKANNQSGHGGSDQIFFQEFLHCIRTGKQPDVNAYDGLASTVIAMAAEQARINHIVVDIPAQDYEL